MSLFGILVFLIVALWSFSLSFLGLHMNCVELDDFLLGFPSAFKKRGFEYIFSTLTRSSDVDEKFICLLHLIWYKNPLKNFFFFVLDQFSQLDSDHAWSKRIHDMENCINLNNGSLLFFGN